MAWYRVLSWREIPAQIKVRDGSGRRISCLLPDRFQQEIDRVAMRDGVSASDAYLAEWSWSEEAERTGDADTVAAALLAELVAHWDGLRA